MEDIGLLDDSVSNYMTRIKYENGDWDNLVNYLDKYSKNIIEKRSDDRLNHMNKLYDKLINDRTLQTLSTFYNILDRIKTEDSDGKISIYLDKIIIDLINKSINNPNLIIKYYNSRIGKTEYNLESIIIELLLEFKSNDIYAEIKSLIVSYIFDDKHTINNIYLIINLLYRLLENIDMSEHYIKILKLFDKFNIYRKDYQLRRYNGKNDIDNINYTIGIKHRSFIINEILNDSKIIEINNNLHKIIRFTVTPNINLRLQNMFDKQEWDNNINLIENYVGKDAVLYIQLFICSHDNKNDDTLQDTIFGELSSKVNKYFKK